MFKPLNNFTHFICEQGYTKKSCGPGFNRTWTKNFQMYKVGLEKAEEPEIKLPDFAGS